MRTVTCACGAVIPSRHVPDYYRLTPNAAEIRRQRRWGRKFSRLKQFMDRAEAATRQGQTIIQFRPPPRRARLRYYAALSTHRLPGICLSAL